MLIDARSLPHVTSSQFSRLEGEIFPETSIRGAYRDLAPSVTVHQMFLASFPVVFRIALGSSPPISNRVHLSY